MDPSSFSNMPLKWLEVLEKLNKVSQRCRERFTNLHDSFPLDLPELPSADAEVNPPAISPEKRRSPRYRLR
jgi:hypothetical protein